MKSGVELQITQDALGRFTTLEHRSDHEVRTAHHVTTGKHLGMRGLEWRGLSRRHAHPAIAVHTDVVICKPRCGAGVKAKGDNDRIGGDDLFGAGDDLGLTAAARTGRP